METALLWKVTNRLGVLRYFDNEIDALELAARVGYSARVTKCTAEVVS
jgi:hypothetical protein